MASKFGIVVIEGTLLWRKLFIDNEESGYKKTVNCANAVE
jgi:hypothetical protein